MSCICKLWVSFNVGSKTVAVNFRRAQKKDLAALHTLEQSSFDHDRLSKRSLQRWIASQEDILLVAEAEQGVLLGYGLVMCNRGTRLARLYSLAISPEARGQGLAGRLLAELELLAANVGRLYMRLEVAENNLPARQLYERRGYRVFGEYSHYYDDKSDALRMQKTIRRVDETVLQRKTTWYPQTTDFSCGPAAVMMAMSSLDPSVALSQELELDLWREATTIFMTSGHGGCHPLGLGLSAVKRGFSAKVFINTHEPLFLDGVRSAEKKAIMSTVHHHFVAQAKENKIEIVYGDIVQAEVDTLLASGYAVLVLISTYRLDGKKAPHWVTVTHTDDTCIYFHDPDLDDDRQSPIDCQHVPIARADFEKMSAFGATRLRTAIALKQEV